MVFSLNTINKPSDCRICNSNFCDFGTYLHHSSNKYVSKKYETRIPVSGFCKMIYNVSVFNMFTIAIKNCSDSQIEGYLEISPDNINYKKETGSTKTILANQLEVFVPRIFLEYTSLVIEGPPGIPIIVFFQGQLI